MPLPQPIEHFLRSDVLERFLRYVKIDTTADPSAPPSCGPSSPGQWTLLCLLQSELQTLGVQAELTAEGYVYAALEGNTEGRPPEIAFLAHVDTSPDQSGFNVKPQLIENFAGSPILYPDDPELALTAEYSPELLHFIGETIITASGLTLLGADDKAGVAALMSTVAAFKKFPELRHGPLQFIFTRDEEIGRGVSAIDLSRLPKYCYTVDGTLPGELEYECFDAWQVHLRFKGTNIHPGYAKGKMVNAGTALASFITRLPEQERPEHTSGREGFYHLLNFAGTPELATAELLLRDFEEGVNTRRAAILRQLAANLEREVPGLQIDLEFVHLYENMRKTIENYPEVLERAREAIRDCGLEIHERPIRGGTDGSKLSAKGFPTPNISAGGVLFHSRREWIADRSLYLACESIVHLARRWSIEHC